MFDLHFQYPQALWLLAAVPLFVLLFSLYLLWRGKVAEKIGDARLVKNLQKTHSPIKTIIKFSLLLLAFSAGCIALANPRKAEQGGDDIRKGIDIVIALDVSNSMLAADVTGGNRLAKARELVQQMVRTMPGNRFALVLFAAQAYVQMPLTYDHSATELFLASASPGTITAQGTGINEALQKTEPVFSTSIDRYKAIVLITDGETHDGGSTEKAAELASRGIMIHTVGIGSAEGSAIMDAATNQPRKDVSGNVILSRLNEPLLKQIAMAAKGTYVNLKNPTDAIANFAKQFSTVEKKALVDTSLLTYTTFYLWFALPMLFLLLIETFFSDRKKAKT